jgi:hypothetical protein
MISSHDRPVGSGRKRRPIAHGEPIEKLSCMHNEASIPCKSGMQPHSYHKVGLTWRKGVRRHESTWENYRDRPVLEALTWVKCPTEAKHARNIHDYGKTIITSYRSHSLAAPAAGTAPAARTATAGTALTAGTASAARTANHAAPPPRPGSGAACRVDASALDGSAPDEPGACRLGRWGPVTARTAITVTTTATARRGGWVKARPAVWQSRSGLTRGSGVPFPARGTPDGCHIARTALYHGFRRGQEAYSASDGTGIRCSSRQPSRSRCERPDRPAGPAIGYGT